MARIHRSSPTKGLCTHHRQTGSNTHTKSFGGGNGNRKVRNQAWKMWSSSGECRSRILVETQPRHSRHDFPPAAAGYLGSILRFKEYVYSLNSWLSLLLMPQRLTCVKISSGAVGGLPVPIKLRTYERNDHAVNRPYLNCCDVASAHGSKQTNMGTCRSAVQLLQTVEP